MLLAWAKFHRLIILDTSTTAEIGWEQQHETKAKTVHGIFHTGHSSVKIDVTVRNIHKFLHNQRIQRKMSICAGQRTTSVQLFFIL